MMLTVVIVLPSAAPPVRRRAHRIGQGHAENPVRLLEVVVNDWDRDDEQSNCAEN
jgi:hypothetical protein